MNNIGCGEITIFDFDSVNLILNSFADECFGKLIKEVGLEKTKKLTTFENMNPCVELVIKKAIKDRINQMNKELIFK